MFEINGKTAVVTGAASGIGLATAKMLLEKGANVVMSDYNVVVLEKEYDAIKETYGNKVACKAANVAAEEEVKALVEFAVEKYGELDIMINNAGVCASGIMIHGEREKLISNMRTTFDININGVVYGCKYAADQMIKQGTEGAIINTSSVMGVVSHGGGCSAYCTSKHAVVGFTKTCAMESAPYKIRVNAICPGNVATGMINEETVGADTLKVILADQPISVAYGRLGDPDEIAHAMVFAIENTFLTGQAIVVDGGYTVH